MQSNQTVEREQIPFKSKRKGYAYRIEKLLPLLFKRNNSLHEGAYRQCKSIENSANNAGYWDISYFIRSINLLDDTTHNIKDMYDKVSGSLHLASLDILKLVDKKITDTLTAMDVPYSIPDLGSLVDMRQNDELETLYQLMEDESWKVDDHAAKLHPAEKMLMDYDKRIELIRYIVNGYSVMTEDEKTILDLLNYTPLDDRNALFEDLTTDNFKLIKKLHSKLDKKENADLHESIYQTYLYKKGIAGYTAQLEKEDIPVFPWADPGLISLLWKDRFSYNVSIKDNGKINVRYTAPKTGLEQMGDAAAAQIILPGLGPGIVTTYNQFVSNFTQQQKEGDLVPSATNIELDPFDLVKVRFYQDEDHVGQIEGAEYYMPAINLLTLEHSQHMNDLGKAFDIGMLVLGVVTGAAAISAASKIGKIIAVADIVFAVGDAIVKEFKSVLAKTEAGRQFLAVWDAVSIAFAVFGIAQLAVEGVQLVDKLSNNWYRCSDEVKKVLGPKANIIEGQVDAFQKVTREVAGSDDLKKALQITHEAKLNHTLDNVEDVLKSELGEAAYDAITPKINKMNDDLDELKDLTIINGNLANRRLSFERLQGVDGADTFLSRIDDITEESYQTLNQVIANTSDDALETTIRNINQFEKLEDSAIIVNKFNNVEEGSRFLNWLDDSGIKKLCHGKKGMDHNLTRPTFYKLYNKFSDTTPAKIIEQIVPTRRIEIPDNVVHPNKKLANGYFEAIDGKKIYFNEQGFPIFDSKFNIELEPMFYKVNRDTHFAIGNDMLKDAIKNDNALKSIFTPDELLDIAEGYVPERFVWHHTQHDGVLELVLKEHHNPKNGGPNHLGGDRIWGVGSDK